MLNYNEYSSLKEMDHLNRLEQNCFICSGCTSINKLFIDGFASTCSICEFKISIDSFSIWGQRYRIYDPITNTSCYLFNNRDIIPRHIDNSKIYDIVKDYEYYLFNDLIILLKKYRENLIFE